MPCIVEGCQNPAPHQVGVRLRKPGKRNAVWAPETHAMVCDEHAIAGFKITVVMVPTTTGNIDTDVSSSGRSVTRRFKIKKKA